MNNIASVNTPTENTLHDLTAHKDKADTATTHDTEQLSADADKFLSLLSTSGDGKQQVNANGSHNANVDDVNNKGDSSIEDNIAKPEEVISEFSGDLFSIFSTKKSDKKNTDTTIDTNVILPDDDGEGQSTFDNGVMLIDNTITFKDEHKNVFLKPNEHDNQDSAITKEDITQEINENDGKEQLYKESLQTDNTTDMVSGASILNSLFQNTPIGQKTTEKIEQPSLNINELSDKIADRILIAQPDANGDAEIRIQIKQDIMPDTEVRITKTGEGIKIDFISMSDDSLRLLNQHVDALSQNLNVRFDGKVVVQVNSGDFSQGNNDGRSRQQRNLYDEIAEE